MMNFVNILVFISILSCSYHESKKNTYLIIKKNEISQYIVFHAEEQNEEKRLILLSHRNAECGFNKEILVGKLYDFDVREVMSIEIEDDVYISLGRSQIIDSIQISDGENFPYLITNSCNGYLDD